MITTKHGNKYGAQEWLEMMDSFDEETQENEKWLEAEEELVNKAATYLNQEFPQVPVKTWARAINSPDNAQFSDSLKEKRFEAALNWIEQELKKI